MKPERMTQQEPRDEGQKPLPRREIPTRKREAVAKGASRNSGKLAFGMTVFGFGFLALGAIAEIAEASMSVSEHQSGQIRIENDRTGETLKIIPLEQTPDYKIGNPETDESFFERLTSIQDTKATGVNYKIENENKFDQQILDDAEEMSARLFDVGLEDISPIQFVKLINAMVQEKLNYDNLSVQKTPEGVAEDKKISATSIDKMYLETHIGVCRHYAALVEEVGKRLQASGAVPRCEGIRIDEIVNIEDLLHAWNVYYFNLDKDGSKVAVSYTDATWDDETSGFFDDLDAKNPRHPSMSTNFGIHEVFTREETMEIMRQLDTMNFGGSEGAAIKRCLAEFNSMAFAEKVGMPITRDKIATTTAYLSTPDLDDEATTLLEQTFESWQETIMVSDPKIVKTYIDQFALLWSRLTDTEKEKGDIQKAIGLCESVRATFLANGFNGYAYDATDKLAKLHEENGYLVGAQAAYRRSLELMPQCYGKYRVFSSLGEFYLRHNDEQPMKDMIESLKQEGEMRGSISSPLAYLLEARLEVKKGNTPKALELIGIARIRAQKIISETNASDIETLATASDIEHELVELSIKLGVEPPARVDAEVNN